LPKFSPFGKRVFKKEIKKGKKRKKNLHRKKLINFQQANKQCYIFPVHHTIWHLSFTRDAAGFSKHKLLSLGFFIKGKERE